MPILPDDSFDIRESGVAIKDDDGNTLLYLTAGTGNPTGQQAPVPTLFVNELAEVWKKFGPTVNDWRLIDAGDLYIGGVGANYLHTPPQCVGGGDANGN